MKLRFEKSYKAIERSAREADRRKCDMTSTFLWWSIHKDDTGFYLEIPEEDTGGLSESEIGNLED